jgi:hypothetical protein
MGTWVELVVQSHRVQRRGVDVGLFAPFEVDQRLTCGGRDCDLQVAGQDGRRRVLEPRPGGLVLLDARGRVARDLKPGDLFDLSSGAYGSTVGVTFRVVGASPWESCGWPEDVEAPAQVPDDAGLQVLGDLLLERGHVVGQRFIRRVPAEDRLWLGAFPPSSVLAWRVGVVDALKLTRLDYAWSTATALRRTALTRVLRRLRLQLSREGLVRFAEALYAQGGLPWLEALAIEVPPPFLPPTHRAAQAEQRQLEQALARLVTVLPRLVGAPKLTVQR